MQLMMCWRFHGEQSFWLERPRCAQVAQRGSVRYLILFWCKKLEMHGVRLGPLVVDLGAMPQNSVAEADSLGFCVPFPTSRPVESAGEAMMIAPITGIFRAGRVTLDLVTGRG